MTTNPEGRPLIEVFAEDEAEPFEGYPPDDLEKDLEPMKSTDINAVGVAGYWKPPSETILNTVDHNTFYLVETLEEVMARANEMDDNTFAMIFDLAPQGGMGQARRILVPWQAVASLVDLSPEPTE